MRTRIAEGALDQVMAVAGRYIAIDGYYTRGREVNLRGTVSDDSEEWRQPLASELKGLGYAVKAYQNGAVVHLNVYPARRRIPWVNVILFALTLLSVSFSYTYVPFLEQGVGAGLRAMTDLAAFLNWQKFTVSLLLILLFHEFGHYLAARRRGIRVSLPYFLPAPTVIGTFGAFIKSNSPFPSRRDLVEVGAYGPIAGFLVAVVVLAIGLATVTARPGIPGVEGRSLVEPLIMRLVEMIVLANPIPEGYNVYLQDNPMLFAAWVGLVVTMLNLLPVGQLDGGHIVYALSPRRHYLVSRAVFLLTLGLGFVWEGWWLWAIMIFFIIRFRHPPTLDDFQPLASRSRWTGWAAIAIFLLTFSPVPF